MTCRSLPGRAGGASGGAARARLARLCGGPGGGSWKWRGGLGAGGRARAWLTRVANERDDHA